MIWAVAILAAASLVTAQAPNGAQRAFHKLKGLSGEWTGTSGDGSPATVSYRVTGKGSALVETLRIANANAGNPEMTTTYYVDGDRLMMTHFCAAGNQPRMRSAGLSADGKSIAFAFQDATNLPSPDAGHMRALTVTLVDADHFTQQWTWHEKGKEDMKDLFKLTRKK
jgi:hypothetical protein